MKSLIRPSIRALTNQEIQQIHGGKNIKQLFKDMAIVVEEVLTIVMLLENIKSERKS